MANSLNAAPAALAQQIIPGLVGSLPLINAFSTNLTGAFTRGKSVTVMIAGGDPAIEFGATGYAESQDADLTAVTVDLKHLHSTKKFAPIDLAEYGEDYIVNAFVQNAVEELSAKVMLEVGSIITAANFSAVQTVTAANYGYDDVVDINTDLSTAKASRNRALILNPSYIGALRKSATLTQAFSGSNQNSAVVTEGALGRIAGMDVFEYSDLPGNSENLTGFACGRDAIAVASALPSPAMFEGEVDSAVDPSGLAVQVLKSKAYDGFLRLSATMLFGVKKARATSLKRIRSGAPA